MNLYALCDVKLGKYYPPTLYQTDFDAKRSISDVIKYAGDSMLARHPEDFVLFLIGYYDDNTGYVTPFLNEMNNPSVKHICNADELVTNKSKLEVVKNEV